MEHPEAVKAIFEIEGEGTYEKYMEMYKDYENPDYTMVKEAIGKMIARNIFKNEENNLKENNSFIQRVVK